MRICLILLLSLAPLLAGEDQTQFASRENRYRLQTDDKFEVQYRYTPEFNVTVSVDPDGFVSLPLVGEIHVAGLTLEAAKSEIRKRAAERLNEPEVELVLREYVKPHFVVAGEVSRPGRYDFRGRVTMVEAIAQSGGFKDSAKHTQVVLLRQVDSDRAEVKLLDMRRMMNGRGLDENLELRPGDTLVVPKNLISRIEPFVRMGSTSLYAFLLGLQLRTQP